MGSTPA